MATEKLNTEILKVLGYSENQMKQGQDIDEELSNRDPIRLLEDFVKSCTIDDFERLKLIATNYEVSTNF